MKTFSKYAFAAAYLATATTAFAPSASLNNNNKIITPTATQLFSTVDDKTEVREYFNNEGFSRWNKIYSDSDEVNSVQLDIRNGHDQTIQKILNWVKDDGDIDGKSVCDCGCGVGSLAIPLAMMGEFYICSCGVYKSEKYSLKSSCANSRYSFICVFFAYQSSSQYNSFHTPTYYRSQSIGK
jgi:hypothetical protein